MSKKSEPVFEVAAIKVALREDSQGLNLSALCSVLLNRARTNQAERDALELVMEEHADSAAWELTSEGWRSTDLDLPPDLEQGKQRQGELEGIERPTNERIESAARELRRVQMNRIELQDHEKAAKTKLEQVCRDEGVEVYRYQDPDLDKPMIVRAEPGDVKVSVRIDQERAKSQTV